MDIQILASGSTGNCYKISDQKTNILLDAGIKYRDIQVGLNFDISSIDACLLTHEHKDHSKSIDKLAKFGTDIYALQDTVSALNIAGHRIHAIEPLKEFTVGTFKILPFDAEHDVPCLGYLLYSTETQEKLLYFTDTAYLKYKFNGLNYILAECNYDDETLQASVNNGYTARERASRVIYSHMSLKHLLEMLKANDLSQVKQIYLLHMSKDNSTKEKIKGEVQKITAADVYCC